MFGVGERLPVYSLALKPALTGWIYYRRSAPHLSALGRVTLEALIDSL